jgi:hypothetical protein
VQAEARGSIVADGKPVHDPDPQRTAGPVRPGRIASGAANLVTGAEYEVTAGDGAKDI